MIAAADLDRIIADLGARLSEAVQLRLEITRRELATLDRSASRSAAHRGLTLTEAAKQAGLSRSTIGRLVESGALKAYGGRVKRILPEVLHAWMGRQSDLVAVPAGQQVEETQQ